MVRPPGVAGQVPWGLGIAPIFYKNSFSLLWGVHYLRPLSILFLMIFFKISSLNSGSSIPDKISLTLSSLKSIICFAIRRADPFVNLFSFTRRNLLLCYVSIYQGVQQMSSKKFRKLELNLRLDSQRLVCKTPLQGQV